MADISNSSSQNSKGDENIIHEQTNPSFHDTPEDKINYKSLQNKSAPIINKLNFSLKPSLLTQKAEQIRTDKAAVIANTAVSTNKFLVLNNTSKDLPNLHKSDQACETKNPDGSAVTTSSSVGFVFGENIFSRVIQPDSTKSSEESTKEFKDLVCIDNNIESQPDVDNDALRKSADELSQKTVTHQFEETEVITGEEEETNILKTLCKLFTFNPERNEWIEKGFCNVHLNDFIDDNRSIKSRLVVRSKGGLKVLVNTLIWGEMRLAKPSLKAVRITARSENGIQSFLLNMQNSTDADSLYHAISMRKARIGNRSSGRKRELSESNDDDVEDSDEKDAGTPEIKKRNVDRSENAT